MVVFESLAFSGLTIAGKALFSHAVYDSYELIKDTAVHPAVSNVLNELDLQAKFKVIEALLKTIGNIENENDPLAIAYHQVDEMIHKIKNELENIKKELKNHQTKYFAHWRTPNCEQNLRAIRIYKKILDERVDFMITLFQRMPRN